MLGTSDTDGIGYNTVILEGDSQHCDAITHTILIEELALEVENQLITLMECRIDWYLKAMIIVWLIGGKHQGACILPYIGGIARSHVTILIHVVDIHSQGFRLSRQSVAQLHIDVVHQLGMAHVIHHRRIEVGLGDVMLFEDSLTISYHIPLLLSIIVLVSHCLGDMKLIENILHLILRQILARDGRLARLQEDKRNRQERHTQEYLM